MIEPQVITDFTAGELSSRLSGRYELDLYRKGCRTLDNWVPFSQGGIRTRPGTVYLGTTAGGLGARLIPFVVSESNAFVVELTNLKARFWKNGVLLGAPTEVVTTYLQANLMQIQFQKVRNELYLVHPSYPIRVLTWSGGTSFSISNLSIDYATDVDAWAPATAYSVGDIVTNGTPTKVYECITAGTSAGSGGPTTEADDITDGTVHWYWQTTKPFSQAGDYPAAIAHFDGRMYYGGSTNAPQTVWGSAPFFYGDFNYSSLISYTSRRIKAAADWSDPLVPETEDTTVVRQVVGEGDAFFFEIASDQDDDIYSLKAADALIINTASSEWIVPPGTTPLNINAMVRSGFGSAYLQAFMCQDAPVFVHGTASKATLREYAYLAESSELSSPDLNFAAEHMLEDGVTQVAVMRVPQPTVFAVTDGELACLLYNKAYGVLAWYHISLEVGTIESVCVVPGTTDDRVYITVLRGATRYVEWFDMMWDTTKVPLDSYVDVASIAGATQSGLDRFDGQTVTIYNLTDSTVHTATVAGGSLTYPDGDGLTDHVVIGLPFDCRAQTMRLGPAYGSIQRAANVTVRVLESMPFKVAYDESGTLETAQRSDAQDWTAAYTGDVRVPFRGEWSRDAWVWLLQDEPYSTTILSLIAEVDA